MGNFNVEMFWDKSARSQVFYVRPFSEEVKNELVRLMKETPKVSKAVIITEKDGTYAVASKEKVTASTFMESFWGMLFRKYASESKRVCIDPLNEEKYYAVIFSAQFIAPCERRLAA